MARPTSVRARVGAIILIILIILLIIMQIRSSNNTILIILLILILLLLLLLLIIIIIMIVIIVTTIIQGATKRWLPAHAGTGGCLQRNSRRCDKHFMHVQSGGGGALCGPHPSTCSSSAAAQIYYVYM